jgi:hypothetical protein
MVKCVAVCVACVAVCVALVGAFNNSNVPELLPYNPVAPSTATVTVSTARFTVLTPTLLRMEYSPNGKFEDRATLAIVNRNIAVPSFTSSINSGVLVITTSAVQLKYTIGSPFTSQTLTVVGLDPTSAFKQWTGGDTNSNSRNLLGTCGERTHRVDCD